MSRTGSIEKNEKRCRLRKQGFIFLTVIIFAIMLSTVPVSAGDISGGTSIEQEIYEYWERYVREAVKRSEAYRQAFLATGGTDEEWAEHHIKIDVGYELKSRTEDYVSFVIRGSQSWTSACDESGYYNIDLKTGEFITLKDILGEDYIQKANQSIRAQMAQRTAEEGAVFWSAEAGGFTGISDKTKFYINGAGNPVIVFDKYEIAPGSAGEVEFEIEKEDSF